MELKATVCVNACFGFGGIERGITRQYERFSVHLFTSLGRQTSFVKHPCENLPSYTVRRNGLLFLGQAYRVSEVI